MLPALQMLSLQQQMVENLVIAKAREETLQQKMEEQWLQLQEAANRRFSSSMALTPEDQEQRSLYTAILKYEQDDLSTQCKSRLKQSPADLSLLSGLFSCLLSHHLGRCRHHCSLPHRSLLPLHNLSSMPLAAVPSTPVVEGGWPEPAATPQTPWESSFEDLEQFLASPEGWAPREPLAGLKTEMMLLEHLRGIVWDIHNAIDRLLSLMLLAFKRLNTATSKDQCPACLEEAFFPPLWALLLALYRSMHQLHEAALAHSMEQHWHAGTANMGLASRLLPPAIATQAGHHHDPVGCWGVRMWGWGVLLLPELMVPISSSRADNLLPILSYVVLQTGLPQLLAECAALEELIYEGYLTGEKGYCLTSLQSTLSYMESLQ
uniref:VPS9 domain-containing protein n=1 Tax=Amazona collaria TaxID=241587 RepID=A0A8B9F6K3_9PSIT